MSLPPSRLKLWLPYAMGAFCSFLCCNFFSSILTDNAPVLDAIFYQTPGVLVTGTVFNIINGCLYHRQNPARNGYWRPQNLLINGEINNKHMMIFCLAVVLYVGTQTLILVTMFMAHLANVNVGIITSVWGLQPLGAAVLDYFINGEKLTIYHFWGMLLIVGGGVCVSQSGKNAIN